jgi:hypothetical protein
MSLQPFLSFGSCLSVEILFAALARLVIGVVDPDE